MTYFTSFVSTVGLALVVASPVTVATTLLDECTTATVTVDYTVSFCDVSAPTSTVGAASR